MFRKGILFLLVTMLILCFPISSNAEGNTLLNDSIIKRDQMEILPLYDYTNNFGETLSISNGTATCKASLIGISGTTSKVVIKMTLQKKTLLWWSEVETWSATYDTYYGTLNKSVEVKSGTYRVKAVYTVYSGSANETITDYSSQKEC